MDNLFLKARLNYLIIAIIIPIIFTYSCKKREGNQLNDFNNAKSWYQNTGDKVATVLKSDQGIEIEIKKDLAWNKAKTIMLDGGTELTTVPITLKSASGANINGNFNLLITKKANQYKSRIVYIDNNANLGEAVTDNKAIEHYNKAFTNKNSSLLKSKSSNSGSLTINNKLMNAIENIDEGTKTCTDWYLVETTYYEDTYEVIDVYEEFLFTKCVNDSSNGAAGPGDNSYAEATKALAVESASELIDVNRIEDGPTTRKELYSWVFLKNAHNIWKYTSIELGIHKKVGNEWQWEDLVHQGISKSGLTSLGVVVDAKIIASNAIVGKYNAGMELVWQFTGSLVYNGFPFADDRDGISKSPVFNVDKSIVNRNPYNYEE